MISIKSLKFVDGDMITNKDFSELLIENEGSFSKDDQVISFVTPEGMELVVNYDINIDGLITEEKGDYWTPGSSDVSINEVEVNITSFYEDGVGQEIELTDNMLESLVVKVKSVIL